MRETGRTVIPRPVGTWGWPPRSLCWAGDDLIDWVGGHRRYGLDGTTPRPPYAPYAYSFDHAIASPDGRCVAIVTRLGTKGVIIKDGRPIREINRSYYYASAYEYPIAFLTLPDGRTGIVHCPDRYCRLEIEVAETGERLTTRQSESHDQFHSRLIVDNGNRFLASAGWVWHPLDVVDVYDLQAALQTPDLFDRRSGRRFTRTGVGESGAAFLDDGALAITSCDEGYDASDVDEGELGFLEPDAIGVYEICSGTFRSRARLEEPAGTLMAAGSTHVVGFYGHPKLIELSTGRVVERWPELKTGQQNGSRLLSVPPPPPLALDPARKRFAVAGESEVTAIQLG